MICISITAAKLVVRRKLQRKRCRWHVFRVASPFPRGGAKGELRSAADRIALLQPRFCKTRGTPEGTRTPHLLLRRQLLYPDELPAHMERVMGIEPTPTAWKAVVLAVILHPHGRVLHQL